VSAIALGAWRVATRDVDLGGALTRLRARLDAGRFLLHAPLAIR
jgi:hypothetical protein